MKAIRWAAAAATVLMSLMNIPIAFDDGGADLATPVAWAISLLGVLGLVAAVGLLLRAPWGRPAVLAVGAVNLAAGVVALAKGWDGAVIGLVVSALILVLGYLASAADTPRTSPAPTAS
jgi:hypothetical protein